VDHFYEQLVTTYKTGFYKIANGVAFVFMLIAMDAFNKNLIFAVILLALAGACFFYKRNLFVEYEYQFTNGEIDIEKILEKKKRSKVLTFHIKEVGLLAPEDSDAVKDYPNKPKAIVRCYPTTSKAKVYVAMVTEGNNKMQLKFVPDDKFLEHCYKYNPRAVKKVI
jgi:hypothetical protein